MIYIGKAGGPLSNSRSSPASVPLKGQITMHTTVKWTMLVHRILTHVIEPSFTETSFKIMWQNVDISGDHVLALLAGPRFSQHIPAIQRETP